MRFGDYEIMRSNQWCYQLYRVMPEGFDNSRSKYRESEDGRALKPLDCYPNDLTAAIRRVIGFSEADAVGVRRCTRRPRAPRRDSRRVGRARGPI